VATSYSSLPNKLASAPNGVSYAYRDAGEGEIPLVLLQHFRGNLDNWDPALVDQLAAARRVVAFDNAGVGGSTGTTPHVIEQMARDAIAFITAMGFPRADLLGFSSGSFVAQEIALIRPDLVRRLILASAAPKGADGIHGWAVREAQYDAVCTWGIPDHAALHRLAAGIDKDFSWGTGGRLRCDLVLWRVFRRR
jgi:pimeloyl-ACP methyl ester carboxylesterase